MLDKRKVVIIGAGHVGSHVAMALCFQGTCDEIVFIDKDNAKAVSNCYDVADLMPVFRLHNKNKRWRLQRLQGCRYYCYLHRYAEKTRSDKT